ncbi:MAG: hypothetical protein Edafosvirus19_21 [Edafosvirus sp.]|uniref:Plastocyanin-like domain-containing protein n=1 Tax=Edafosvirus sp. TaxID=2487765 RepID=A0A3G4ZW62_9VIRU|nr:MAG: hypothetical protein Edafosvirus19_21 [Edafosvirus sp.]
MTTIDPNILDPRSLDKYIQEIQKPEVLIPTGKKCGVDFYEVSLDEISVKLHPQVPLTKIWTFSQIYPPPMFEVKRNNPIYVKWDNRLPLRHLLEECVDDTLMGAQPPTPAVRTIIHLHGGEDEPSSDGFPNDWYTPGYSLTDYYPNEQLPTMLWFHDHAISTTRLNAYAGLAGGLYFIRDPKIDAPLNLPSGKYEMPLVIQDRTLYTNGNLFYPIIGSYPGIHPHWIQFFSGNLILVNGIIWPFMNVEPRKYRFRILNASNSRGYSLTFKIINVDTSTTILPFYQIGSDGGYLPKPILINGDLVVANAERMDIVIDFAGLAVGTKINLENSLDVLPEDEDTVGKVMRFNVINLTKLDISRIDTPRNFISIPLSNNIKRRQLLIDLVSMDSQTAFYLQNTDFDEPVTENPELGSTEIWEIINAYTYPGSFHPIHLHLIQFQLLNRQPIDSVRYSNDFAQQNPNLMPGMGIPNPLDVTPYLTGPPVSSIGTNEYAWKDTIQAYTNNVTRILVKFAPQAQAEFSFDATKGLYVWHCHIVEHEDNDMMRPLQMISHKKKEKVCRPKTKLINPCCK